MSKHQLEKDALLGDRAAIIQVVSDLRGYRAASAKLLAARYRDGACDGFSMSQFNDAVQEIEECREQPSDTY